MNYFQFHIKKKQYDYTQIIMYVCIQALQLQHLRRYNVTSNTHIIYQRA